MRTPTRKSNTKYARLDSDPHITEGKFIELKENLKRLKNTRPHAASEVARLAELGDFSENAAYQMAKGRLKGINRRILETEDFLNRAVIITPPKNTGKIQIGNKVTIKSNKKQKTFQILGSTQIDPAKGVISHNSPLGSILINRKIGDKVKMKIKDREIEYEIIEIE